MPYIIQKNRVLEIEIEENQKMYEKDGQEFAVLDDEELISFLHLLDCTEDNRKIVHKAMRRIEKANA